MSEPRPIAPEELFAHAGFLRNLARTFLRDENLAEDVAQEAMVLAWERPPRERTALRAWLAATVRNLALNRRSADARRARREESAARPELVDPQTEALERLEHQRAVFSQVLALDEAKRTVLFLRYHEGLEPAAISARLGVPVKTVKTRLARGLEELRAQLERRYGGDRRALGTALIALTRCPALGKTTVTVMGGLMTKWIVGLVSAAALLLAWFGTRGGRIEGKSEREPAAAGTALTRTDEPQAAPSGGLPEQREPSGTSAKPRSSYALGGTVRRRGDGAALAGVTVEVDGSTRSERVRVTTDAEGFFRLEREQPMTVSRLTVLATETSARTVRNLDQRLIAGETLRAALWVSEGARLSARVVDQQGEPVPGATVRAWCDARFDPTQPEDRRATSAADGSFVLGHLGESFVLCAEKPGLACVYGLRGQLADGAGVEDLEVVMAEAAFLAGHVVDERGRPIAAAELRSQPHMGSSDRDATRVPGVQRFYAHDVHTTTDATGAFVLGPVARQDWDVRVTHPEFLYVDRVLDPNVTDNRIELAAGQRLAGLVSGPDGVPVSGAAVSVHPQHGEERRATTDASGRFEVAALSASENAFVLVDAAGFALHSRQPVSLGPGAPTFLDLRLEREVPLSGRVVDVTGRPLADVLVRAEGERLLDFEDIDFGERTTWEWRAGRNEVRTDTAGRFRFVRLYPGSFTLLASPPDEPRLRAEARVRSGSEDVEIVLDRAALERVVFTGTATDGRTREPLPTFRVTLMHAEEGGSLRGGLSSFDESAQGRFRLVGFAPGRYDPRISAAGYATWSAGLSDYGEGEHRFDAVLWPTCTVRFAPVDERGRPVDARLEFHDLDGRRLFVDNGTWTSSDITVSSDDEVVPGLPTTLVRVTATSEWHRATTLDLDLSVPPTTPIPLVLPGTREEPVAPPDEK